MSSVEELPRLQKYWLYCSTENCVVTTCYKIPPGTSVDSFHCPNDASHTIVPESVQLVSTTFGDQMKTYCGDDDGNKKYISGNYTALSLSVKIDDPSPTDVPVVIYTEVTKFNMIVFRTKFITTNDQMGDRMVAFTTPAVMPILPITQDVDVGAQSISTLPQILANLQIGFNVSLLASDDGNIYELGRILNIDWPTLSFQTETATTRAFPAFTTTIQFKLIFADIVFGKGQSFVLGSEITGGGKLPKGYRMGVEYYNRSGGTKEQLFLIEGQY